MCMEKIESRLDFPLANSIIFGRATKKFWQGVPVTSHDKIRDAYTFLSSNSGCSVDDILVDPTVRSKFLEAMHDAVGDVPEHLVLRRLLNLRKRSLLPRSRGQQRH